MRSSTRFSEMRLSPTASTRSCPALSSPRFLTRRAFSQVVADGRVLVAAAAAGGYQLPRRHVGLRNGRRLCALARAAIWRRAGETPPRLSARAHNRTQHMAAGASVTVGGPWCSRICMRKRCRRRRSGEPPLSESPGRATARPPWTSRLSPFGHRQRGGNRSVLAHPLAEQQSAVGARRPPGESRHREA